MALDYVQLPKELLNRETGDGLPIVCAAERTHRLRDEEIVSFHWRGQFRRPRGVDRDPPLVGVTGHITHPQQERTTV